MVYSLTEEDIRVVKDALKIAGQEYFKDAQTANNSGLPDEAKQRLMEQFEAQAEKCMKLLDTLEL